jgi:hypothetical protein
MVFLNPFPGLLEAGPMPITQKPAGEGGRARQRSRSRLSPLSPLLFLWRNPGQTVPLATVIVMAVMLIAGIVALLNSIPNAIRTVYGYSEAFALVWPRGGGEEADEISKMLDGAPHVGSEYRVRLALTRVKTLVGEWPFFVYGLDGEAMRHVLDRLGLRVTEGRLPRNGQPEVLVSRSVARNKGLGLGSVLLDPQTPEEWAPMKVRVVGIADGKQWFAVTSSDFIKGRFFPDSESLLLMAGEPRHQRALDGWVTEKLKNTRARVFTMQELDRETREDLATLYVILDTAIAALVILLATMMGMLANIHFSQRMVEFGLLQAIGHSRRFLLARVMWETLAVVVGAWVAGCIASHFALEIVRHVVMEPKGYPMETAGWSTYRYTLCVPVAVGLFALVTVWWRFRRFDPVAIVERRLV